MEEAMTFDGSRRRAQRVWLCLGIVAGIAAMVAAWLVAKAPAQTSDLLLIYVGAEDCAPCRTWQTGDGAEFRKSPEFARIGYREVKSPRLRDLLEDEHWPEDLRAWRGRLKRSDGVPLWLIVSGNEVVTLRHGATAWQTSVMPTLRSHLR